MARRLLLIAAAVMTLAPASASAAAFRLTDQGEDPDVVADESGAGHFVWNEPSASADVIRYCRVPSGATACATVHNLVPSVPGSNFDALGRSPRVHVRGGEVTVTTHRGDDRTWVFVSTDGGQSFSVGRPIMRRPYSDPSDAVRAGGDLLFQTYGRTFQAASVYADSVTEAAADIGAGLPSPTGATVGLLAGGLPIVVLDSGERRLFFRRYDGSGDPNDLSNWTALADIGAGSEPLVRSGPSGTFLYHVTPGPPSRYVMRKWTGAGFGPPVPVEDDAGYPEAGDLAVDPAGGVHAIWGQEQSSIRYRRSLDGGATFSPAASLAAAEDVLYHPRLSLNSKRAGYVTWDSNAKGVVSAEAIGSSASGPAPGPAACAAVRFAIVEAILKSGCFARDGKAYVARGKAVIVNGLALVPRSNGTRIVIDRGKRTITSDGVVVTQLGAMPIDVGKIRWEFGDAKRQRMTGFEAEDAGGKNSLFGFPVKGEASVDFLEERSEVTLNVGLPSVFGGLRGQAVVRSDNVRGVRFDGLTIRIGDARLGALQVKDLVLQYVVGGNFSGAAQLILPPNPPGAKITGSFSFKDGKFAHAEGDYRPPVPVPIGGPVSMTHLGFGLFIVPAPTRITAQIGLLAGPQIFGKSALGIEATGFFAFPSPPKPAHLHVEGVAHLASSFELASASFDYYSNGLIKFAAKLDKPLLEGLVRPKIQVAGFVDFSSSRFSFDGRGVACFVRDDWCPGDASTTLSSRGMAACGQITMIPGAPSMGIAYKWGGEIWSAFKLWGCDAAEYSEAPPASPARTSQSATSFMVPAGSPTLSVAVRGHGRVPKVRLVGPGGRVVIASSPSQQVVAQSNATLVEVAAQRSAYVGVRGPAAGRWRVEALPGSAPIATARFARGLPEPRVSARVRGSGRKRQLAYRVKRIPGQRVVFVERSPSVARILGSTAGGTGTIAFSPADGRRGARRIDALVEQDGLGRRRLRVARYRAPGPARPAKPRLRLRRARKAATVRWRKAPRAARYEVRIRVDDGRRQLFFLKGSKRRFRLGRLDRRSRATIAVTGLRPDLRRGPTARVKVKPVRRRR